MSNFYLDSSALVKRFLPEIGTGWIRTLGSVDEFYLSQMNVLARWTKARKRRAYLS